jgi:hypothetical protein
MQNYYTSIEIEGDGCFGVLYEKNTNRTLYKTQKYFSQSQAMKDINNYISSNQSTTEQTTIINSVNMQPLNTPRTGRCCGR